MIYCDLLILPRKISVPTQDPCEDKQDKKTCKDLEMYYCKHNDQQENEI